MPARTRGSKTPTTVDGNDRCSIMRAVAEARRRGANGISRVTLPITGEGRACGLSLIARGMAALLRLPRFGCRLQHHHRQQAGRFAGPGPTGDLPTLGQLPRRRGPPPQTTDDTGQPDRAGRRHSAPPGSTVRLHQSQVRNGALPDQ